MKSAALPAAETLEHPSAPKEPHLRLVPAHDTAPRVRDRLDVPSEPSSAEDPDEMWDNLPV